MLVMPMLSGWWFTEYAEDIAFALKQKEQKRILFQFQSPQSQFRPSLVGWMSTVAERMKLCNTTVHLSIYILDVFMDNHSITTERLILVALVCLLLAAKFEERDVNVPKIHELNELVQNQYPINDFILLEIMTLKFLHWNLVIPTVAHFAEYYVTFSTLPSDLKNAPHFSNYSELQCYAYDYVKDYLDESLKDVAMHQYQPSLVAASCIAATRLRLHLNPKWTSSLCEYTSYEFSDLQQCVQTLMGTGESGLKGWGSQSLTQRKGGMYVTLETTIFFWKRLAVTGLFYSCLSSLLLVVGLAMSMVAVSSGQGLILGSDLTVVRGPIMWPDVLLLVRTQPGWLGSKRKLEHSPDNGYVTEESSPDCVKQKRLSIFASGK
uniref:Uncharacterized protein n=1 Tax=Timema shepardi TaxID=629360 RepID=A0A7R9FZ05_TIMSH|nr:unnamed protein product [Timema shepardi]